MSKIIERNMNEELQQSFLEYARAVITERALPDARDGLKPGARRVLYAMKELGLGPNTAYKKSARITGDVIGKYHPHGDSAVYDTMVRMAQDFSLRYPLVDGHGNFGSIDGDSPAAMRYTEARLSMFGALMLEHLEYTVPFEPNYDESLKEPKVLPSKIPHLLINGVSGIAVGMSSNMVPHHGKEILRALLYLLKNRNREVTDLSKAITKIILAPDFPTGGIIVNPQDWEDILVTGRGRIILRSRYVIEQTRNRNLIIFYDVPYMMKKTKILEEIVTLSERVEGITDIRDESGREGIRIVVETKKDVDPKIMLARIYRGTSLETNISIQNQVLVEGKPKVCGMVELLEIFTDHRLEMLYKKLSHDLEMEERLFHILEGKAKALKMLNQTIKTIRESKDKETAKKALMAKIKLTELQAEAILALRLSTLTSLEISKVEQEKEDSHTKIQRIVHDLRHLPDVLEKEWQEMLSLFQEPRRTEIANSSADIVIDTKQAEETAYVTVAGDKIYRTNVAERGVKSYIECKMNEYVHIVSNTAEVLPLKVTEIPEGKKKALTVKGIVFYGKLSEEKTFIVVSKDGKAKKVALDPKSKRKHALGEDILFTSIDNGNDLLIITERGMAIRFPSSELPSQGKSAKGVSAIKLEKGDQVIFAATVKAEQDVFMKTNEGIEAKKSTGDVPLTHRAGKGVKSFCPTYKTKGKMSNVVLLKN